MALIDDGGSVVEFLSYEGSFTAGDGPAAGLVSVDIAVFEPNDTPLGLSLQLQGAGNIAADFAWTSPSAHTRGAINNNQTFEPNGGGDIPTVSTWGMVIATLLMLAAGAAMFRRRLV